MKNTKPKTKSMLLSTVDVTLSTKPQKTKKKSAKTISIALITSVAKKDREILLQLSQALSHIDNVSLTILAQDESYIHPDIFDLSDSAPKKIQVLECIGNIRSDLLLNSECILLLSENKKIQKEIMKKSLIPIVPETTTSHNYDPVAETGHCFEFETGNIWSLFSACIRARETFQFSYDWKNLQTRAQESSLS